MRSEQSVCNSIKSIREYIKLNTVGKTITTRIGKEDRHVISVHTGISMNVITGTVTISECIYYMNKTISADVYGKQNCHDAKLVDRMTKWSRSAGKSSRLNKRKADLDKYFPLKEFDEVMA